jgi:hypothetical protein
VFTAIAPTSVTAGVPTTFTLTGSGVSGELQRSIIENADDDGTQSPHFELDRKAVWGLYCMYAIIGLVYGFIQNFITIPICYYVFGPLQYPAGFENQPTRSSLQQCNIGTAITTMPWNLKVFYGLFLDQFGFFGTRRKGWIIFGWTGGLGMLVVCGALSASLAMKNPEHTPLMATTHQKTPISSSTLCSCWSCVLSTSSLMLPVTAW